MYKSFRDMSVWQNAMKLSEKVFRLTVALLINFGKYKIELKRVANIDGKMKHSKKELPTKDTEITEN